MTNFKSRLIWVGMLLLFLSIEYVQAQNMVLIRNRKFKNRMDALLNNAPKQAILEEGMTIHYMFKNSDKVKKEKIENILFPFYLIMNGKHYPLSKLKTIKLRGGSQHLKKIIGPVVIGTGLGLAASGVYVGNIAGSSFFGESSFLLEITPLALATTTLGIGAIIVGLDLAIKGSKLFYWGFRKQKFDLEDTEHWEVTVITEDDYKELKKKKKK